MRLRRERHSAENSIQIQPKKGISMYLVVILSIAFNSLVVLNLNEYLLNKKVANVERGSEQSEDIKARQLPSSNPRQLNLLDKYPVYLLSAIVSGIPPCLALILLNKKLASSRKKETEDVSTVEISPPSDTVVEANNIATRENQTKNQTLGYDPNILLANLSHELRSPLNAILGFAQIMEQELASDRIDRANIAIVNRSGERLLSIVNDLVDLAKIEIKKFTLEQNHIDFGNWLENIEQSFNLANKNWQFSIVRQSDLPQYICLDERRLRQILTNIINYCWQQPSQIKVISLIIASPSLESTQADSQNSRQHNLNFEVETDCAIADRELATLFDPIIRARQESESTSGNSLSLPISRRLAQLMGGDLSVNRRDSSIIFDLEIRAESTVDRKSKIQSSLRRVVGLESDRVEYRILIVDDSITNRKIMLDLLEPVGFTVREAVNGKEAVDIWLEWQPHMIWMDLRMPVMNGYEATEVIKSRSQSYTPIVALSATTLEEEKQQFRAAGCDDFVGKPFIENVIFDKIAQHLGIRYVYEPESSQNKSTLTEDLAAIMPSEWLKQLELAALMLDKNALSQLLEQIPLQHLELKQTLQQHLDNFDYDEILSWIKKQEIKP